MRTKMVLLCLVTIGAIFMSGCADKAEPVRFSHRDFCARALPLNEERWEDVADRDPPAECGVRWIYDYALLLAESGKHLPRIDRLVHLGERMQDKAPGSPTFGNFRWYRRTDKVTDLNAVEFVTHHMLPLWIDHRGKLGKVTRTVLERTLRRCVDGCLRHAVKPSYTNIAISNAVNLILLGEQFDRKDALAEGLRRLEAVCLTTWRYGICEYDSPTYYGVDLDMLVLLDRYVQCDRGRRAGQALLSLFWTDIAVNWFEPGRHLAGTHSRSYNFPCGASDFLDRHLEQVGWIQGRYRDWTQGKYLDSPERRYMDGTAWLDALPGPWRPPTRLRDIMRNEYPREIVQRFGPKPSHWRRHVVYRDITLSCSGHGYGVMDQPVTVSLPGDVADSRCYFIPDGREDPYGKRKFPVGSAGHTKALHLSPLWAAAGAGDRVLALSLYPDSVLDRPHVTNLQSHFVMRIPDAIYLDGKRSTVARDHPLEVPIGAVLALRYGTAVLAVSIPWATTREQEPAPVRLVDDGNPYGVLRLTAEHGTDRSKRNAAATASDTPLAGIAMWVCVGSEIPDSELVDWLAKQPRVNAQLETGAFRMVSTGGKRPVRLAVTAPWKAKRKVHIEPAIPDGILSLNGKELGRPILEPFKPASEAR